MIISANIIRIVGTQTQNKSTQIATVHCHFASDGSFIKNYSFCWFSFPFYDQITNDTNARLRAFRFELFRFDIIRRDDDDERVRMARWRYMPKSPASFFIFFSLFRCSNHKRRQHFFATQWTRSLSDETGWWQKCRKKNRASYAQKKKVLRQNNVPPQTKLESALRQHNTQQSNILNWTLSRQLADEANLKLEIIMPRRPTRRTRQQLLCRIWEERRKMRRRKKRRQKSSATEY